MQCLLYPSSVNKGDKMVQMREAKKSKPHPRLAQLLVAEKVELHGSRSHQVRVRNLSDEGQKCLTATLKKKLAEEHQSPKLKVTSSPTDGGVYISTPNSIATPALWWEVFDIIRGWGAQITIVH